MLPQRIASLSLLLATLCPAAAFACTCIPPGSPEQEAARADHVFVGRVVSTRPVETLSWWRRLLVRVGLSDPPEQQGWPEYTVSFRGVEALKGRPCRPVHGAYERLRRGVRLSVQGRPALRRLCP